MTGTLQIIDFIEKIIFRGKKPPKELFSEKQYSEYLHIKNLIKINHAKIPRLSSGLKRVFIDLINSVNPSRFKYTNKQRLVIQLMKERNAAELLMGMGFREASIDLYQTTFNKAEKHKIPKIGLDASREIFQHEARFEANLKKASNYFQSSLHSLKCLENEILVEWYLSITTSQLKKKKNETPEMLALAKKYFNELRQIPAEYRTSRFERFYTAFGNHYYLYHNQLNELTTFLTQKVTEFESDPTEYRTELRIFRTQLIQALLRTNNLENVVDHISANIKNAKSKNNAWFRAQELMMLYQLKVGDYLGAISLYEKLKSQRTFKATRKEIIIKLELNYIYAVILFAMKCNPIQRRKYLNKIKMAKFINSIPDYTKDKKGMNIPVYIASILYYILSGDEKKIESEFNYLEKYVSRYLKTDPLYRSNAFFKMLLQVYKHHYHPSAIRRHAEKHKLKLAEVDYLKSTHPKEIEEIPYEILWENLLQHLSKRKIRALR